MGRRRRGGMGRGGIKHKVIGKESKGSFGLFFAWKGENMQKFDVVIIGGGASGCMAALNTKNKSLEYNSLKKV